MSTSSAQPRLFPCSQCGSDVRWNPAESSPTCTHCGARVEPPPPVVNVHEIDFEAWRRVAGNEAMVERIVVHCSACAGETTLPDQVVVSRCAFCGVALSAQGQSKRVIKPAAVLPFRVGRNEALDGFRRWIGSRWFAPSALADMARTDTGALRGVYLPFWTYDASATTEYTGQRGDNYTDTETYTTTENGQSVTRTRTVIRTRWSYASGTVRNRFDDLLVPASGAAPAALLHSLEPWDLAELTPYADEYVAGFEMESYAVGLEDGFTRARELARPTIEETIRDDIGGDHQQISEMSSDYRDVTFKHLLLPLWICTYRFRDKPYRFAVNARTGEVQGERPWSWIKITFAVLAAAAIIAIVVLLTNQ